MKKSEALMLLFLLRADEFYLLTRFCNRAFLQYMTYRIAHHALEYYLKAGLSTYLSTDDMKKFGHDIESLWKEYEPHFSGAEVDVRIISHINRFETMRYPGGSKFIGSLWGVSYEDLFSEVFQEVSDEVKDKIACFSLPDFDKLICTLRNSLPQGNLLPIITATNDAEIYLFHENKYFSKEENDGKITSASS